MNTSKYFITLLLVLSQLLCWGQKNRPNMQQNKEKLQAAQIQEIENQLKLNEEQKKTFREIYTAYLDEFRKNMSEMKPQMLRPKEKPNDQEIEQRILESFKKTRQIADLKEKYYYQFRKLLSPSQIQEMYQIEKMIRGRLFYKANPMTKDNPPRPHEFDLP